MFADVKAPAWCFHYISKHAIINLTVLLIWIFRFSNYPPPKKKQTKKTTECTEKKCINIDVLSVFSCFFSRITLYMLYMHLVFNFAFFVHDLIIHTVQFSK